MEIPKKYKDLVGTKQTLSGGLFSGNKALEPKEYDVLDIRVGTGTIVNIKQLMEEGESTYEHPVFQLLVKNKDMKKSQWTRGFPIREINLNDKSSN